MNNFAPASFNSLSDTDPTIRAARSQFNGRLFLTEQDYGNPYELYQGEQTPQNSNVKSIQNIIEPSAVAHAFFANRNVDFIQTQIIKKINKISSGQYNIGRQDDTQLNAIMKSYFLQYGKNLPNNIDGQVEELNNMVINECVKIIIPNIQQHIGYLKDITSAPPVMPLPVITNNTGNKLIDVTQTFWDRSAISVGNQYNNIY